MGFFIVIGIAICLWAMAKYVTAKNEPIPPTKTQVELAQKMYGSQQPEVDIAKVLEEECARIEAMIQADETGRADVKQQILDNKYSGPLPERRNDGGWTSIFDDLRILSVAGINHRQGINRYTGRNTIALVPEPTNEFDANAIKVVAEDGHLLGYIRRDQTEMVRSWARDQFPMYCVCRIEEKEDDDDGHRFFTGYLYIKKQ